VRLKSRAWVLVAALGLSTHALSVAAQGAAQPAAVEGAGRAGLSQDVSARRARMMDRLGPDAMLILLSAPVRNYSLDVDYEYRQDSNLYYLSGLAQEDTALVLMPGNATRREILFVKDQDPSQEHWHGRTATHEQVTARTGVRTVLSIRQFEPFVSAMLSRRAFENIVDDKEAANFFEALGAGRARGSPSR